MLKIQQATSVPYLVLKTKVQGVNPGIDQTILLAYYDLAPHFGIDPAVAIAQACNESNWFRSERAVQYNNYCGLGANSDTGVIGFQSDSRVLGVLAHLCHLYRYVSAIDDPLAAVADPRFHAVLSANVGKAVYVDDLGGPGKWTDDTRYGFHIWQAYIELGGK